MNSTVITTFQALAINNTPKVSVDDHAMIVDGVNKLSIKNPNECNMIVDRFDKLSIKNPNECNMILDRFDKLSIKSYKMYTYILENYDCDTAQVNVKVTLSNSPIQKRPCVTTIDDEPPRKKRSSSSQKPSKRSMKTRSTSGVTPARKVKPKRRTVTTSIPYGMRMSDDGCTLVVNAGEYAVREFIISTFRTMRGVQELNNMIGHLLQNLKRNVIDDVVKPRAEPFKVSAKMICDILEECNITKRNVRWSDGMVRYTFDTWQREHGESQKQWNDRE